MKPSFWSGPYSIRLLFYHVSWFMVEHLIHGFCFGTQVELVYLWIVLFSATVSFLIKGFIVSSGLMQYSQEPTCWVMKNRVSTHIVQFPNGFTLVQSLFSIIPHASYPVEIYCLMEDPRCVSVSYDHPVPATGWPQLWRSTTHRGINRPFGVYTCVVT